MLHLNNIRAYKNDYIRLLKVKNFDAENFFNELINLDDQRKKNQKKIEDLLSKNKSISNEIGKLYKVGSVKLANTIKQESLENKQKINEFKQKQETIKEKLQDILIQIPNVPHSSVPNGNSESKNEIIKESGHMPILDTSSLSHWDLAKKYNLINFELGNKITGSGFPVYIDKGAKLQRALINCFLDKNKEAGYLEYLPPHIVNKESAFGTGNLPDKEGQMYHIDKDDFYLIPTAEVPITNIFRDSIVDNLPIKCTSYTPCFRREAGSYGSHVRGLNRLHQFDKVEIVQIEHPEKSYETLNCMVDHVSQLLDELKLPYRVLKLCGGDMSFTSALTYDFEVYSAAQKKWLEVSSVSNFESFQSNRMKIKFKDLSGKNQLCHTLNGSALALPRIFASILENNQTKEGIIVPEVLHSYTGFEIIK